MTRMSILSRPLLLPALLLLVPAAGCDRPEASPEPGRPGLRLFWTLHDRAKDLYARGDYPAAREAYLEALEKNPAHPASLYNLAHIDHLLGRQKNIHLGNIQKTGGHHQRRRLSAPRMSDDRDKFPEADT